MELENVNLRKSRRAKRLLLSVNLDGTVELVIPWRVSYREAERFLREKEEWLRQALKQRLKLRGAIPVRELVTGESLPCLDGEYVLRVEYESGRRKKFIKEQGAELIVKGRDETMVRSALTGWYKEQARDYFTGRSIYHASKLGVDIKKVVISQAKTQWGSCNAESGRLSYNWRLLLGPKEVADYVAVHEVAHMKHQNHSPAFWEVVRRLDSDYEQKRKWLKKNGYTLVL